MSRLAFAAVAGLMAVSCSADGDATADPTEDVVQTTTLETATTTTATTATANADEGGAESVEANEAFPDVVNVQATQDGDGTWTFDVTLSSPYDSPERYADAWRVAGPEGTVFGERILLHDHASEQPFTRSQSGISIPEDVKQVVVEGRDQVSGWGGETITLDLAR